MAGIELRNRLVHERDRYPPQISDAAFVYRLKAATACAALARVQRLVAALPFTKRRKTRGAADETVHHLLCLPILQLQYNAAAACICLHR